MIYCSQITSNLLIKDMRINPACIRALPLDKEQVIEGIPVTLIDANHCPGAVLLLFKTPPPKGSVFSHEVHSSPPLLMHTVVRLCWCQAGLLCVFAGYIKRLPSSMTETCTAG